jgi:hypothetical protein
MPVTVDDQEGAPLLPGPRRHGTGPGGRHHAAAKTEHHQIQPIHQYRGHFDRIDPGVGDHRKPAEVGTHLDGSKQPHVGLTHDRRGPTRRSHRRHQSQRQ